MKKILTAISSKIYDFLEEILYISAFMMFNTAMFEIGYICGLITLSILMFIMALLVTFIKINKVNKGR